MRPLHDDEYTIDDDARRDAIDERMARRPLTPWLFYANPAASVVLIEAAEDQDARFCLEDELLRRARIRRQCRAVRDTRTVAERRTWQKGERA